NGNDGRGTGMTGGEQKLREGNRNDGRGTGMTLVVFLSFSYKKTYTCTPEKLTPGTLFWSLPVRVL
ncbi:MAG: hypothetical protein U9P80_10115, partial [Thermodesulfobacteriota bacterium]|nr:hypothetical protein [Thermodesulfobacteriota bacterium]